MKQITIAGNIGRDAVVRRTNADDAVAGFSVAVEERNGQDKRTLWFDCSLWGKRGEALAQYLTKGSRVTVAGDLSTREHEGRTYLTVRVAEVTLQGGGERRDDAPRDRPRDDDGGARRTDLDDEIPF